MHKIRTTIANRLQALYEANRVPETWGSPSVSRETFDQLRARGFIVSVRYLFTRLREVGRPDWSPARKFAALIAGILLVTLVNKFLHTFTQERRPEIKTAGKRKFSVHAPKPAIMLYAIGATLLVAENGEEVSLPPQGAGDDSDDNSDDSSKPGYWGPSSIFKQEAGNIEYQPYTRFGQGDGDVVNKNKDDMDDFEGDWFDDNYNN